MKSIVALVAAAGFSILTASAQPVDTGQSNEKTQEESRIDDGLTLLIMGHTQDALDGLKLAIADKTFDQLPAVRRHFVYTLLAEAAFDAGDNDTAAFAVRRACTFSMASDSDWGSYFHIALRRRDIDGAATSLTVIAEKYPARLSKIWDVTVLGIANEVHGLPDGKAREFRLLKALFTAQWRPTRVSPDAADKYWTKLVLADLDAKNFAEAKAVGDTITDPNVLVMMVVDKRFDSVVATSPNHYDIAAAAEASLTQAKNRMADRPDLLEPADAVATALMRLDRNEEALTVLDTALAKVKPSQGDTPYIDVAFALPSVTERRGKVLARLGRDDESLREREKAAAIPEFGTANVNQALNLADKMNGLGRPQDALALLQKVPAAQMSPYGQMIYQRNRACAYALLKDTENAADALAYLKSHSADGPTVPLDALMCMHDLDGAAAEIIARLGDPDSRLDMLFDLQNFCGPKPAQGTPDTKPELKSESTPDTKEDDWTKVSERPDVQAAIAKVGRVKTFPILLVR